MNPSPDRRRILQAACAALVSPAAQAQGRFPARSVRLLVPFPAGTSPDVVARLWGDRFTKATGQAVVVENRPGAGTIIAAQAVSTAAPDGYTLFWTVNNTFSINPFIYRSLPYRLDDFVPLTRILSVPFVLIVSSASKIHSLAALVAEAKARPGQMTYASPGIGTSPHVVMARLLSTAGVTMTHVPYKDSFLPDVIAQRVDVAFDATTTTIGNVAAGKVRALGISSAAPVEALPEVPTIAATYPGFAGESWHGVFAPRGTAADVVATIVDLSNRIVESADFRATLKSYGLVPVGGTPAAFQQFLADDSRSWAEVIRANRLSME